MGGGELGEAMGGHELLASDEEDPMLTTAARFRVMAGAERAGERAAVEGSSAAPRGASARYLSARARHAPWGASLGFGGAMQMHMEASMAAYGGSSDFSERMHFAGAHVREMALGAMRSGLPPSLLFSDRVRGSFCMSLITPVLVTLAHTCRLGSFRHMRSCANQVKYCTHAQARACLWGIGALSRLVARCISQSLPSV